MLYDSSVDKPKYSEYLNLPDDTIYFDPEIAFQSPDSCIRKAIEYFGITLTVVLNYEDAIENLKKQSKPGYCDYYAVWVFCGPKKTTNDLDNKFVDILEKWRFYCILGKK